MAYLSLSVVPSINENNNQRGLAHLLAHMAFNSSEHFKDNSLQEPKASVMTLPVKRYKSTPYMRCAICS